MRTLIGLALFAVIAALASACYPPPPKGKCGGSPLPTEEDLAPTPRPDENLELLALRLYPYYTADPYIYDRLVADVSALRQETPEIADIQYYPPHDGKTLEFRVAPSLVNRVESGSADDWDCMNEFYGMQSLTIERTSDEDIFAVIELKGIYNLWLVAQRYERLFGVLDAYPISVRGDGPTICVTVESSTYHYVFDQASGDCQLGCTAHHLYYFVTERDGSRTFIGSWATYSGEPEPWWVAEYGDYLACRRDPHAP